ncbi:hypothetical protein [Micromonospora sp. NPDC023814]|uniref:WXG100 family type VII secretion target n=1 Tax=Micromonospora sp. NPDC023814 TaxID=3154596 RepID=UPI0033DC0BA4
MGVENTSLKVPTELGEAGPFVRQVAGNIIVQLNDLARQLAPLQDTWTGDAYVYFNALEQSWNLSARGLFGDGQQEPGILGDIAHRLDVAWYNYVTTQNANTKQWMH